MRPVADRIETSVAAKRLQRTSVGVAIRAQVKLLGPPLGRVEMAKKEHQKAGILPDFLRARLLPTSDLIEDRRRLCLRARICVALLQSVVGEAATMIVKILVTLTQRFQKIGKASNVRVRRTLELIGPVVERSGIFDVKRAVWAERRKNRSENARALDPFVMLKAMHGIICGAHRDHAELLQDSLNSKILRCKLFVRT